MNETFFKYPEFEESLVSNMNRPRKDRGIGAVVVIAVVIVIAAAFAFGVYYLVTRGGVVGENQPSSLTISGGQAIATALTYAEENFRWLYSKVYNSVSADLRPPTAWDNEFSGVELPNLIWVVDISAPAGNEAPIVRFTSFLNACTGEVLSAKETYPEGIF